MDSALLVYFFCLGVTNKQAACKNLAEEKKARKKDKKLKSSTI